MQSPIPPHLENHPHQYRPQFPMRARVTAVFPKDHNENYTKKYTCYQVEYLRQRTTAGAVIEPKPLPFGGSGFGIDMEVPLVVGQLVAVGFFEGDPEQPYIQRRLESFKTAVAQEESDHPRVKLLLNGTSIQVDKDGNVEVDLVSGKELAVKAGGSTMLRVTTGVGGEVQLGGTTALKTLMNETASTLISTHTHGLIASPNTPLVGPPTDPTGNPIATLLTTTGLTSTTKAK